MKVIYQKDYKKNGSPIRQIQVRDITKREAKEIRDNLRTEYSKVEMNAFEVWEDRPRLHPDKTYEELNYKGYIFYIWLDSKI